MSAVDALNAAEPPGAFAVHPTEVLAIGSDEGTSVPDLSIAAAKRLFDIVASLTMLVLAAPLLVAIAVVVRSDGGPVLVAQRRIGQGGRIIKIKKFRSMAVDAEERLHSDPEVYERYFANGFKLPENEDPRLTRWGRLLRSTSLDELPQLLSVLKGDLSMVGPRPIVEPEFAEFISRSAGDAYLAARPGLTGLCRISGRSTLSDDERVALDVGYLDRANLFTDLRIVVETPLVVLRRVGAH